MLGIGAFVAGWVSYGTYIGLHTTAQWRLPLALQMVPAVGLGMFRMPVCCQDLDPNVFDRGINISLS